MPVTVPHYTKCSKAARGGAGWKPGLPGRESFVVFFYLLGSSLALAQDRDLWHSPTPRRQLSTRCSSDQAWWTRRCPQPHKGHQRHRSAGTQQRDGGDTGRSLWCSQRSFWRPKELVGHLCHALLLRIGSPSSDPSPGSIWYNEAVGSMRNAVTFRLGL